MLLNANAEVSISESAITIKYLEGDHQRRLWLKPDPGKEAIAIRADNLPFDGPEVLLGDDYSNTQLL